MEVSDHPTDRDRAHGLGAPFARSIITGNAGHARGPRFKFAPAESTVQACGPRILDSASAAGVPAPPAGGRRRLGLAAVSCLLQLQRADARRRGLRVRVVRAAKVDANLCEFAHVPLAASQ